MQLAQSQTTAAASVLPHNEKAAATWGSPGQHYDRISEIIADALELGINMPREYLVVIGTRK